MGFFERTRTVNPLNFSAIAGSIFALMDCRVKRVAEAVVETEETPLEE